MFKLDKFIFSDDEFETSLSVSFIDRERHLIRKHAIRIYRKEPIHIAGYLNMLADWIEGTVHESA